MTDTKQLSENSALLISDSTAAQLLGISRATFWRRVQDGTFPQPVRFGGATRWRSAEIEAFVNSLMSADRANAFNRCQ